MTDTISSREIRILPDAATLNRAAADEFIRCAREAIAAHGRFSVALSGGSTPKAVYGLLAGDQADSTRRLPLENVHFFFGDERAVAPTDPESNYRMASESLLSNIPVPPENVHQVKAEIDAKTAAGLYQEELRSFFRPGPGEWPRFDLIMLGMGPDGHTASLFPGSVGLSERSLLVMANWVEKFSCYRITFTYPVLNAAAEVMFLVSGESKAEMLKSVLEGPDVYPCQKVKPANGRLLWMVDQPAGRLLTR